MRRPSLRYFPRPDVHLSLGRGRGLALSELALPGAPEWLRGRTLLFASDFHLRPGMDAEWLVARMSDAGADMILLGGDYADRREQALRLFDAFRALRAPLGIFAVAETTTSRRSAASPRSPTRCARSGRSCWSIAARRSRWAAVRCAWRGVDEYRYGRAGFEGLFSEADGYRILLSHYPILPDGAAPDLMLSGHTHGGQFNLFGLTPYGVGFERFGARRALAPAMVSGARRFGRTTLVVSKGDRREPRSAARRRPPRALPDRLSLSGRAARRGISLAACGPARGPFRRLAREAGAFREARSGALSHAARAAQSFPRRAIHDYTRH